MQLIDREQLERIIDRYIDETGADTFTKDHLIDFLLDSEPVDAVPVVRCKNCGYCDKSCGYGLQCRHPNGLNSFVCETDFCSYG